ncbi:MAG: efflux RND transporter periplasmic adaptor subunit [Oscillospiraceae bacterium]|nr:efflux RND transporter periplasmic adaptor subunit [Oscillospiraceae bacterium]
MKENTQKTEKRKVNKWIWIGGAAALILALLLLPRLLGGDQQGAQTMQYTLAPVQRGDVTAEITGTGTLEAADSYVVTSLVEATILTADFEEGDTIHEGDVLYTIDSSSVSGNVEQAQIALGQSRRSYQSMLDDREKLTVTASADGRIVEITVDPDDDVLPGQQIALIRDTDNMTLEVPFAADDAAAIAVGDHASVTLDSTFETLSGTVSKISAIDTVLSGNRITRTVTIDVRNPGGLTADQTASATVGAVSSAGGGTFAYGKTASVTAEVGGTVERIIAAEGDRVRKGDPIAQLSSSTLDDQLQTAKDSVRNAEIALESRSDQLDNYTITSPISGTVIDKNYKAGENTEVNKVLCTIYDLSYLTMTLAVDELDISNVAVGQSVQVTADAVEGKTFAGVVTKVSPVGTSANGAATYPVTIRIDETEGLLPGMTVDATIVLDSAKNVLTIPAEALSRGDRVLVTADSPSASNGQPVEQENGETEYYTVEIATGVSDEEQIEVRSGLQEGDTVAYIAATRGESSPFPWMNRNRGDYGGDESAPMRGGQ